MTDPIEKRIRQHYCADNGEWLVEKGKVKEAKLLKEACEAIEKLRRQYETSERNYYRMMTDTNKKERELEEREKRIAEREARFESKKTSFIKDFERWV
jgi:DNA repair exonuclease SbcCD ATPase subunit